MSKLVSATYLLLGTLIIISCSTKNVPHSYEMTESVSIYFNKAYDVKASPTGAYSILFRKEKKFSELFQNLHYALYDHKSKSVIYNDTLYAGKIEWISDHELKALTRILRNDGTRERIIYIYDAKKKLKKTHKSK